MKDGAPDLLGGEGAIVEADETFMGLSAPIQI